MTTTQTTYTGWQVTEILRGEGHDVDDIEAVINSLISAGLDLEPDEESGDRLFTAAEVDILREQLGLDRTPPRYELSDRASGDELDEAFRRARNERGQVVYYDDSSDPGNPGWVLRDYSFPSDPDHYDETPL